MALLEFSLVTLQLMKIFDTWMWTHVWSKHCILPFLTRRGIFNLADHLLHKCSMMLDLNFYQMKSQHLLPDRQKKAFYPPTCVPPELQPKACSFTLPQRISCPPEVSLQAAATKTQTGYLQSDMLLTGPTLTTKLPLDHKILQQHDITNKDMQMIYLSPHPFRDSFKEEFRLRLYDHNKYSSAGLVCILSNGKLFKKDILPSTQAAKIRDWRSRFQHAWLIKVNGETVNTVTAVSWVLGRLADTNAPTCMLLLAHSEIKHGLVKLGIPQIYADQLNHCY
jgi:hypothetical protein